MGSFSFLKADGLTKVANVVYGMPFKFLIPKEFGGGFIKDNYQDYGYLGSKENGDPKYDMHELLAFWNADMLIPDKTKTVREELKFDGEFPALKEIDAYTDENRNIGIDIFFGKEKLKFPLKLVSASYKGTYEDCEGESKNDPNQGFGPLYREDLIEHNVLDTPSRPKKNAVPLWRDGDSMDDSDILVQSSFKADMECRDAIKDAIDIHFKNNKLNSEAAKSVAEQFSFVRIFYVLATNIQHLSYDGRITRQNKDWAAALRVANKKDWRRYSIHAHPGILDLFVTQMRFEYRMSTLRDIGSIPDVEVDPQDYGRIAFFFGDTEILAELKGRHLIGIRGSQVVCGEWNDLSADDVETYCKLLADHFNKTGWFVNENE